MRPAIAEANRSPLREALPGPNDHGWISWIYAMEGLLLELISLFSPMPCITPEMLSIDKVTSLSESGIYMRTLGIDRVSLSATFFRVRTPTPLHRGQACF